MSEPRSAPVTVPAVRAAKVRDGHDPLVMVTAYDAPGARGGEMAVVTSGSQWPRQIAALGRSAGPLRRGVARGGCRGVAAPVT